MLEAVSTIRGERGFLQTAYEMLSVGKSVQIPNRMLFAGSLWNFLDQGVHDTTQRKQKNHQPGRKTIAKKAIPIPANRDSTAKRRDSVKYYSNRY